MIETLAAPPVLEVHQPLPVQELQEQPTTFKSAASSSTYSVALAYLRTLATVRLLAFHSVLAYYPFIPAPTFSSASSPFLWLAFPVLDAQRWVGFALFVGFNDTFFMALMFFLSGLFVWPSLRRKGAGGFLRDRLLRLGLPFLVAAALAPLAYYPASLQAGQHSVAGFWHRWISMGVWPTGPAWFIWLLLAFDCIAAGLYRIMPRWGDSLGGLLAGASRRPAAFYALLVAVSSLVYVPMAHIFVPPTDWIGVGPFVFQASRILHYLVYFLIAVGIGAYGVQRGLLASEGKLAKRWPVWVVAALVTFAAATVISIHSHTVSLATPPGSETTGAISLPHLWETIGSLAMTFSCAACCFAFLALFLRFSKKTNRIANSLRDNAYGMYLVHFTFVIWIQYAFLKMQLPAPAKGALVFLCTLALCWIITAAVRRIPAVARVIS